MALLWLEGHIMESCSAWVNITILSKLYKFQAKSYLEDI